MDTVHPAALNVSFQLAPNNSVKNATTATFVAPRPGEADSSYWCSATPVLSSSVTGG